jgi:hypothetical protein
MDTKDHHDLRSQSYPKRVHNELVNCPGDLEYDGREIDLVLGPHKEIYRCVVDLQMIMGYVVL